MKAPFHKDVSGTFHANVDCASLDKVIEIA
jgi:hypothetical protein